MFVFFVSKIIFLFFSQTCYTLCFSSFDFIILFIEKVGAVSMNSFISPPSKLTHLHDHLYSAFSPLLWLKGQLKHLGLRSYPSHSWYSLLSFFAWVFPSLLNSLIIPVVYWLLALKRLSLTLHTTSATVLFLFSPVSGKCHIFQKGESNQWSNVHRIGPMKQHL